MNDTGNKESASLSFEEAFNDLQEVVERLELGNLPLDESIALFEKGTALVQRCTELLDQAELRIEELSQSFAEASSHSWERTSELTNEDK